MKWFDNKYVVVGSSFAGVECTNTVERYDLEQKKKVKNDCPDMVSQYNRSVGRVYLADMLIALYRTNIITRKRRYIKLIFHCVDIAKVNAWLLYRRHFQQKEVGKKLQMNLRTFTTQIASAFAPAGKDPKTTFGRPKRSISAKLPMGRNTAVQSPVLDIRCDKKWGIGLRLMGNRSHCQKRNMTYTVKYSKCQVGLCLNKDRNFFKDFYNSLLVFSHSFFPKNIPQAALTFCHFYYPYLTCCIIARNCKIGNFKKIFLNQTIF